MVWLNVGNIQKQKHSCWEFQEVWTPRLPCWCVKTADKQALTAKAYWHHYAGIWNYRSYLFKCIEFNEVSGHFSKEISIKDACIQHFNDIGHDASLHDVTYENTQARERTQILMDIANKHNGIVIGTGDLSELALGWATHNGDHMSMYAVNSGIPKTLVRYLVDWVSHTLEGETELILRDVLDTQVSPELLPADEKGEIAQKTEDLVGPYELHDFSFITLCVLALHLKKYGFGQ